MKWWMVIAVCLGACSSPAMVDVGGYQGSGGAVNDAGLDDASEDAESSVPECKADEDCAKLNDGLCRHGSCADGKCVEVCEQVDVQGGCPAGFVCRGDCECHSQ